MKSKETKPLKTKKRLAAKKKLPSNKDIIKLLRSLGWLEEPIEGDFGLKPYIKE